MDLAKNIRNAATKRGLTLKEVAEKLDVTAVALSYAINGNPTINKLADIAAAIGCDVGEFFITERAAAGGGILAIVEYCGRWAKAETLPDLQNVSLDILRHESMRKNLGDNAPFVPTVGKWNAIK